jgi:hypothetical protein
VGTGVDVAVGAGVAVGPGVLVGGGTGVTVGRAVGTAVGTVVADGADFIAVGCSWSSFSDDEQDPMTAIMSMTAIARTVGRIGLFN